MDYFAFGALSRACLLTQRFAANSVLAGVANTAFEHRGGLSANHTFSYRVTHVRHCTENNSIVNNSLQDFYLLGVFQD